MDLRKVAIYFLFIARFFDGDSACDATNEWGIYIPDMAKSNIAESNLCW